MKTGKNQATNNFIIRLWSPKYYKTNNQVREVKLIDGTITDTKSKEVSHFHSAGEFLFKLEKMHKKAEKNR
jgi:hypothetical protein